MVVEQEILPYLQWLLYGGGDQAIGALPRFLLVLGAVGIMGFVLAFLLGYTLYGRQKGWLYAGEITYRGVKNGFRDLFSTSVRRVWAIARLAMKESWRRRVIVALGVFFIILIFANWYLSPDRQDPARLYIATVLGWTTFLVLVVALLLSSFSLPADFKSKTIYTIATKPVRPGEIVLGRIIGFSLVATLMLAVMGVCSYVFVIRSLDHTHTVDPDSLTNITDAEGKVVGRKGRTSQSGDHRHEFELNAEGVARTNIANGHSHVVEQDGETFRVSAPEGFVRARIPQYGKLRFIDRSGAAKDTGISVGSEWTYRSFIDGNTPATAIWTFENIDESINPDHLPLALIVRVFRTHKGVIGRPISGQIQLRNPDPKSQLTSDPLAFDALDSEVAEFDIARAQTANAGRDSIDLYKDLVSKDGKIEVLVKCLERGQYYGFAQADAYIRFPDGSPVAAFAKVLLSIWVQALIVISVGVMISTVVSGPVAMLFTVGFIILGFWRTDFLDIATGKSYGGGPAESVVRIATQANVMVPLPEGVLTTLVTGFDKFIAKPIMWSVGQCLPDFDSLSTVNYAAEGYNVPWDRVLQDLTTGIGYVVALSILGFFLLRTREVAR